MKVLTFTPAGARDDIRTVRFCDRSSLPLSAACLVASGIREALASILNAPVVARLLEPVIPSPYAWSEIARGAVIYRLRGSVADAALILRPADATALAAAVFGERATTRSSPRSLSPIERDVLERTIGALAGTLAAVCGTSDRDALERVSTIGGFVTFFEIAVEQAVDARIGIALSRDPAPEPHGKLDLDDLSGVRIAPSVFVDLAATRAAALASISVGSFLPFPGDGFRGRLGYGGQTLARGTCGARGGNYALVVENVP